MSIDRPSNFLTHSKLEVIWDRTTADSFWQGKSEKTWLKTMHTNFGIYLDWNMTIKIFWICSRDIRFVVRLGVLVMDILPHLKYRATCIDNWRTTDAILHTGLPLRNLRLPFFRKHQGICPKKYRAFWQKNTPQSTKISVFFSVHCFLL